MRLLELSAPPCSSLCLTRPACRQIWAAMSLWGNPAAENKGIFWPRAIEFMVSIVEMPAMGARPCCSDACTAERALLQLHRCTAYACTVQQYAQRAGAALSQRCAQGRCTDGMRAQLGGCFAAAEAQHIHAWRCAQ